MNSIAQSVIEKNIDLIDADLGQFIYTISLDLMQSDFEDILTIFEDAGLDVLNGRKDALHLHISHAAYWFKNNKLPKMTVHSWIADSFYHFVGFTIDEIEDYIIDQRNAFKEYILITPATSDKRATVEVVK